MLEKASSQDLTEGISEAEKAIKEHNELKVCASSDIMYIMEHVNVSIYIIKPQNHQAM